MSSNNGPKMFLWVVRYSTTRDGVNDQLFLIRSYHTPDAFELSRLLHLDYDQMRDTLEAERYDLDALPTMPPKQ